MGDNVEAEMHTIGKVHVRMTRLPKHNSIPRSHSPSGMTGGIVAPAVSFRFDNTANKAHATDMPYQELA